MKMRFHFRNASAWGYPDDLDAVITRQLCEQRVRIIATNEAGDTIYVELGQRHGYAV